MAVLVCDQCRKTKFEKLAPSPARRLGRCHYCHKNGRSCGVHDPRVLADKERKKDADESAR